jgi:dTDP-L-rhamnose 4-epimerase
MQGRRILVTGGAGFIGTALATRFAKTSSSWSVLDNLLPQVHGKHPPKGVPGSDLLLGDVRSPSDLDKAITTSRPDVVFHLAAETGTGQSLDRPSLHADTNVLGTAQLLEALDRNSVTPERIVLTSSRAVYGEGAWIDTSGTIVHPAGRTPDMLEQGIWDFPGLVPVPSIAGTTRPAPSNVYGATKLAQENVLAAWALARGVRTSILRLQNVYGPGQSPINPYTGITTIFFNIAERGEAIPVYEDGEIVRDFIFIDDVVQALGTSVRAEPDVLADVGSGVASTITNMAQIVSSLTHAPTPRITGQYRLGDVRKASCDMSSSAWLQDDVPPVKLSDGLERLGIWMRAVREADPGA